MTRNTVEAIISLIVFIVWFIGVCLKIYNLILVSWVLVFSPLWVSAIIQTFGSWVKATI